MPKAGDGPGVLASWGLLVSAWVGEWQYREVVADVPPQAVQPLWLDHQEENDEAAEQDQPQIGDNIGEVCGRKDQPPERFEKPAGHDGQQRHKGGAEDRAE